MDSYSKLSKNCKEISQIVTGKMPTKANLIKASGQTQGKQR